MYSCNCSYVVQITIQAFGSSVRMLLIFQTGFHTVYHSLLRVLVMMIGELDFGSIFIDTMGKRSEANRNPLNPFPRVGFFFLFVCLFLLTIALMNLLVRNGFHSGAPNENIKAKEL